MYIPSSKLTRDIEIICPYTGESYVYVDEEEAKTLSDDILQDSIEILPERFHKHPRVFKAPNGEIRVYGIKT